MIAAVLFGKRVLQIPNLPAVTVGPSSSSHTVEIRLNAQLFRGGMDQLAISFWRIA